MRFRQKPHRSKAYLSWAKHQHGTCCICGQRRVEQLHHFGSKGIGQKCSDLLVCRVCEPCHSRIQGKRRIAFERRGELDVWADMLEDALLLLEQYTAALERNGQKIEEEEDAVGTAF